MTRARKKVVVICAGEQGRMYVTKQAQDGTNVHVMGFFDDRVDDRLQAASLPANYLGKVDNVSTYCRSHAVDQIVIALPNIAAQRLSTIIKSLDGTTIPVYVSPGVEVLKRTTPVFASHGPVKVFGSHVTGFSAALKRLEDIIISLTALLIFSPIFIVVPILIKFESPGPIFFRQKRYGLNNTMFDCLKFRSMHVRQEAAGEIKLTERNDPRVTKIGNFLRRTSFDELPQLINILKGDMSVIGPRPHPPGVKAGGRYYEEVVDEFLKRYHAKPGLTGWAQVNGARGNTFTEDDLRKRFEYDMAYIQNWSLWLDIVILFRTVFNFGGKNAF